MPIGRQRSYCAKPAEVSREWYQVDATDRVLGRLATQIATVLMGKHKPIYTPHVDTGDFVVVTHADKIRVTGNKANTMHYDRYTYYVGGFRSDKFVDVQKSHPERIITMAVKRMLPKSTLGRQMLKKLKVYAADTHPHSAQNPQPWRF